MATAEQEREERAVALATSLGVEKHEAHLRLLWRDLADSQIEEGVDWPGIVRTLFGDLDRIVGTRDTAKDIVARIEAMHPSDFKTGQEHLPPAFREVDYRAAFLALGALVNELEEALGVAQ